MLGFARHGKTAKMIFLRFAPQKRPARPAKTVDTMKSERPAALYCILLCVRGFFDSLLFIFLHSVHIHFSRFFCGFPQGFVAANTAHSKMWCFFQWLQNDCNLLRKYCTSKGWLCYNKGRVFCIRKK